MTKRKLGEILIETGVVAAVDVEAALNEQSAGESARLGDQLVSQHRLTHSGLARALAIQYGVPFERLGRIKPEVLALIPYSFQKQHRLVPLGAKGSKLKVAMADLSNQEALDLLKEAWSHIDVVAAPGDEIDSFFGSPAPLAPPTLDTDMLFGDIDLEGPQVEELIADLEPAPSKAEVPNLRVTDTEAQEPEPESRTEESLPEWLVESSPTHFRLHPSPPPAQALWTGALDSFAPSQLVKASVVALVKRGVLSEQDILDALQDLK
jgi:Type II secretion system (T2SS), protein E, N-terminal domain